MTTWRIDADGLEVAWTDGVLSGDEPFVSSIAEACAVADEIGGGNIVRAYVAVPEVEDHLADPNWSLMLALMILPGDVTQEGFPDPEAVPDAAPA